MRRFHFLLPAFFLVAGIARAEPIDDANRAFEAGRFEQAARLLAPLAQHGHPVAQLRLGILYFQGSGVKENERQAIAWWRRSADQGNLDAMYQLGNAFAFGNEAAKTVPDPDREAAWWYFQAASAGHRDAQYGLALMFLAGKGVIESRAEALRWMQRAAEQGHADARHFVAGSAR
jgi:TPR repeat protein